MSNGFILYRGPSIIDGSPIVAIVTGIEKRSQNSKTGDMLQTWILHEDVSPTEAVKTGEDFAICGSCIHRGNGHGGKRSCYVAVHRAPLAIWKAYKRGNYPEVPEKQRFTRGRLVRIGAYGDPCAVPSQVWRSLLKYAAGWTGYTHRWSYEYTQAYRDFLMASVDSPQEAAIAQKWGWRTFRVRGEAQPLLPKEVICPASEEAGKKINCELCRACGGAGTGRKGSIAIVAHGVGAGYALDAMKKPE